jgi:hypothetical protein
VIKKALLNSVFATIVVISPTAVFSQSASDVCSELAAHPDDPLKNPSFAGVPDADFEGTKAIDACIDAYTANPNDPTISFQLARAYIQIGDMEQGWSFLTYAAELGSPAAMHLYGKILEANGEVTADELGVIYGTAKDAGFGPAEEDAERYPAPEVTEPEPIEEPPLASSHDLSRYSRPELIKAMIDGDLAALKGFRVGVIIEELGLSVGLLRYMSGFDQSLSSPFYCPADLPAGVAERLSHYINMTALGNLPALILNPDRLFEIFGRHIENPTQFIFDLMAMETELAVAGRAGTRDAVLLAETGCGSPELLAIGKTLHRLLLDIQH